MEKIYMEDNNNKKSTTNRFLKGNGIVTASVLIAIVAVFAFVATSFNNPSWAAVPTADSKLSDQFTLRLEENASQAWVASNESDGLPVSRFWANDRKGISVFCLEENIDAKDGTSYHFVSSDTSASDYGILYILANGYYNKDSFTKDLDNTERVVVTQLALWNYLYDKDTNGNSSNFSTFVSKYGIANGKATRDFYAEIRKGTDATPSEGDKIKIYNNYISKLVSAAKTAKASDTMPSISISGGDDNISLTEDKKYYQSSAIVTVSSGNTKNFMVSVDDSSPKGTILVDDKGDALNEKAEHAVGKEFFVRVPVDSVGDKGATVNLSLTAIGYKYTGKVYKPPCKDFDDAKNKCVKYEAGQTVIGVNVEQAETKEGAQVKFDYVPEVPNTGMNTSQIIYFIGLVILVCGVGIVYANIKPKESN